MFVPNVDMLVAHELLQTVKYSAKSKQMRTSGAHEPPAALATTRAQQQILTHALTRAAAQEHSMADKIPCCMHQNRRMLQPLEPPAHINTVADAVSTASDHEQDEKMAAVVSFMEQGHKLTNQILEENFRPPNKSSDEKSGGS